MYKSTKRFQPFLLLTLSVFLLSACGNTSAQTAQSAENDRQAKTESSAATSEPAESADTSGTRTYTDKAGNEIEIPVSPQRVVYIGSDPGDLLAIGVKPLGAPLGVIRDQAHIRNCWKESKISVLLTRRKKSWRSRRT